MTFTIWHLLGAGAVGFLVGVFVCRIVTMGER
jgi:hypothetical protein